jgi:site-specific DNA-methyltransferase (adenine-specific)
VNTYSGEWERQQGPLYADTGGASRFFYCAKASKKDRHYGLPDGVKNDHPTVKPTDLMRYLVRLITPPGGVVLDPFMGSGTTGVAAVLDGFGFVGIDQDEHYVNDLAAPRVAAAATSHAGAVSVGEDPATGQLALI